MQCTHIAHHIKRLITGGKPGALTPRCFISLSAEVRHTVAFDRDCYYLLLMLVLLSITHHHFLTLTCYYPCTHLFPNTLSRHCVMQCCGYRQLKVFFCREWETYVFNGGAWTGQFKMSGKGKVESKWICMQPGLHECEMGVLWTEGFTTNNNKRHICMLWLIIS